MKKTVLNPQDFPCWEMLLTQMMDDSPALVMSMYREGTLMSYLDLRTARLVNRHPDLHSLEADVLASLFTVSDPDAPETWEQPPLTEEERDMIWSWTESLPENRSVTIEA